MSTQFICLLDMMKKSTQCNQTLSRLLYTFPKSYINITKSTKLYHNAGKHIQLKDRKFTPNNFQSQHIMLLKFCIRRIRNAIFFYCKHFLIHLCDIVHFIIFSVNFRSLTRYCNTSVCACTRIFLPLYNVFNAKYFIVKLNNIYEPRNI